MRQWPRFRLTIPSTGASGSARSCGTINRSRQQKEDASDCRRLRGASEARREAAAGCQGHLSEPDAHTCVGRKGRTGRRSVSRAEQYRQLARECFAACKHGSTRRSPENHPRHGPRVGAIGREAKPRHRSAPKGIGRLSCGLWRRMPYGCSCQMPLDFYRAGVSLNRSTRRRRNSDHRWRGARRDPLLGMARRDHTGRG